MSRRAFVWSVVLHSGLLIPMLAQAAVRAPTTNVASYTVQESMLAPERHVTPPPEVVPPPVEVEPEAAPPPEDLPPFAEGPAPVPRPTLPAPEPLPRERVELRRNVRLRPSPRPPVTHVDPPPEPSPPATVESAACTAVLQPVPGQNPDPVYPAAARRRHIEGVTTIRIEVADDGFAATCRVVASSGNALLDEAALRAARSWRFQGGPGVVDVPFRFELVKPS